MDHGRGVVSRHDHVMSRHYVFQIQIQKLPAIASYDGTYGAGGAKASGEELEVTFTWRIHIIM